jgi:hypothetical protein
LVKEAAGATGAVVLAALAGEEVVLAALEAGEAAGLEEEAVLVEEAVLAAGATGAEKRTVPRD